MRQHTKRGGLCYEPFSGSGTQLVAAEQLGRICYGMELSPPFVAVALERLSGLGLKTELLKETRLVASDQSPKVSIHGRQTEQRSPLTTA